ncbi:nuclear transport factor 2 family protein [Nocardia sp. NBC_01329]|uniref:nuclear transport factor 2 family protein n=1 Tax=Nocardia sp. NBC_01329 TaxID=2903594 RepID=UPI002E128555|nr:nuclear transport factor 2 family protein [Nocardia sp. NBC_01329]
MKIRRRLMPRALFSATVAGAAGAACLHIATDRPARALRELTDRAELTALVDRLARALDERDFDRFRTIYTTDATAQTPGGEASGRDALTAQASRSHSPDQVIQHFVSNIAIDLATDTAEIRANLLAVFAPATTDGTLPNPRFTLGEIYRFSARRLPEGWRLSRVHSTPVWSVGTRF